MDNIAIELNDIKISTRKHIKAYIRDLEKKE